MVAEALRKRKELKTAYTHRRAKFAHLIGLAPKAKHQKLAGIGTVFLPSLKEEYPPSACDIFETDDVQKMWEEHRKKTNFPDTRGSWKPYHKLDPECLQYTVKEDESVIIRDSKSKEIVCMVIRNFSNNEGGILEWVNGIIEENTEIRKSVRVCVFPKHHSSLLTNILAGGSWKVVPDRLHCRCTERS